MGKRLLAVLCTAAILMTSPGLTAFAADLSIDEFITEVELVTDESVTEESIVESETEEPYVTEEEYLEPEEVIAGESSIVSEPYESVEEDLPVADEVDTEETIGAGETVTVGDGVTAKLVNEEEKDVLYFDSKGGTLWNDWKNIIGEDANEIEEIRFSSGSGVLYLPSDSSYLFANFPYLTTIDLRKVNTSSVNDFEYMFYSDGALKELDLSSFNTSNATNMGAMFRYCQSITRIELSSFKTSNVTNMYGMFWSCEKLIEIDVSSFDTAKVTKMNGMFLHCESLTSIDVSNFDTSNVTDLNGMFGYCSGLKEIDVSNFDTSNVTDMHGMFSNCDSLTNINLSNFDTSNVERMDYMFSQCKKLTKLDLSGFNTPKLKYFDMAIYGCPSLQSLDLSGMDWSTTQGIPANNFLDCKAVVFLKTPQKCPYNYVELPRTMYDEQGNRYTTFPISKKSITLSALLISQCTIEGISESYEYTGQPIKPSIAVKNNTGAMLKEGTDYIVSYNNNNNIGSASLMVTGIGSYLGEKTVSFSINKATPKLIFASENVSKTSLDGTFTNTLTMKTDGTVTFKSSNTSIAVVNSTSGLVTIKGIGTATITATATAGQNYNAGSASYVLTVVDGRTDVSGCMITISPTSYAYDGNAKKPTVTVKNGSTKLTSGTDYTISYSNNTSVGTATVKVTGIGKYKGEKSTGFTIVKATPKLTFANGSVSKTSLDGTFTNALTKTTDGTVTFKSSNTSVATVNNTSGLVTIKGLGTTTITATAAEGTNYKTGSANYKLTVYAISIEKASVGGVSLSYGYSGKAYTPTLTIKVDGVTLTKDTDYTVKYENNKNPGTAKITVTGKGKYSGTKTRTFEIVDCVSSVVSGKTYLLIPKNNAKTAVCAYAGKMVNNTKVYITDRGNSESQKFKAVKNSDGTWKFINSKCELALAVQQNSSELGAGIVLYDQTTKPAQNWKLSKKSDNSFAIINSVTGYSIAMSDKSAVKGTTLSMAETASVGLQRFYIVETSAVSAPFDGTKSIRAAKDKNFSVNIASASKAEGANVSLYTYTNSNARKFNIIYSGGGYYRLVNVNSGLCLTIKDNSNADGANVIQSKWKGYSSQRWKITKNSDGTVTITNMLGTVLHLLGNRTVNNTNIHARKAASTTAQKWYLN